MSSTYHVVGWLASMLLLFRPICFHALLDDLIWGWGYDWVWIELAHHCPPGYGGSPKATSALTSTWAGLSRIFVCETLKGCIITNLKTQGKYTRMLLRMESPPTIQNEGLVCLSWWHQMNLSSKSSSAALKNLHYSATRKIKSISRFPWGRERKRDLRKSNFGNMFAVTLEFCRGPWHWDTCKESWQHGEIHQTHTCQSKSLFMLIRSAGSTFANIH